MKEAIQIGDVVNLKGWRQPDWVPEDRSWIGAPLYFKDKVMGMLVLTRSKPWAYTRDDALTVNTYAVQAAIAIENARLYDEINRFNLMMERMVAQRVEELNRAYTTLEKLDKNKSTFIQVAAHELRTPLTVIKGYLGMIKGDAVVQGNETLLKAIDGVLQGTERLHQIVNSMLDVARLESQVLKPKIDLLSIAPVLRLIQKEYQEDLGKRNITLNLDRSISDFPPLPIDPELIQKALDNVIVNAIKFTPDGGSITVSVAQTANEHEDAFAEIRVKDTGIGTNLDIIFEKLYQLGKVEFHSSGRTTFKGGGPGLGLAIAAGIIKSHGGRIWAESSGYDEKSCPGSTFFVRLPMPKEENSEKKDSA
jgi:signal transduction histidine kinase